MDFWIVEDGELHLYERKGECKRCGACCCAHQITFKSEIASVSYSAYDEADEEKEDWSEREGESIFKAQGIWWYFKTLEVKPKTQACECYSEDEGCAIWQNMKLFKPICRYWPYHPKDLGPFPECGFSFERKEPIATE